MHNLPLFYLLELGINFFIGFWLFFLHKNVEHEYWLRKKNASRQSVPIILAHAIIAHKTQGMTIYKPKTCSLDVTSAFDAAQAYVMLGRPQSLEELFIRG